MTAFAATAVMTLASSGVAAPDEDPAALDWPETTHETRPWTRWWWLGNILDSSSLQTEMEAYARAGLGGLEITPIYGVRGREAEFIPYLSPAWMSRLQYVLREAERLDLGVDMATGTGWPFGGPWIGAELACRNLVVRTYRLTGGERLGDAVTWIQEPMVRAIGRTPKIGEIREPIAANPDLQGLALEQVRFEKPLPLQVLMAFEDAGVVVDLTSLVTPEGRLDWVAPEGSWTLIALFMGWHGKMVERAGPGGEGNVIDHFSVQALEAYLARFDSAFDGHDLSSLRAFFNDSYEVDDASGQADWTPRFFDEFAARRGYDLRPQLRGLLGLDEPEINERVLCDYRETISDLLLESFTRPWRAWAHARGAMVRNQAHGSPANILDLYAASDIPEAEGRDLLRIKLASSAAHLTGRPLASAEAATWLDEHFLASLAAVKGVVDQFFLGGINHIIYHGTAYSPREEPWPGWLFYAAVELQPTNPFWAHFSPLNEYVTRVQSFLQRGRPDPDVVLYYPIHDRWSQCDGQRLQHFGGPDTTTARDAGAALYEAGYDVDFVSDRLLESLSVEAAALRAGDVAYQAVVVPSCQRMPLPSLAHLLELVRGGGTVIFEGGLPSDVPGLGRLEERRRALCRLTAQLTFSAADAGGTRCARLGSGRVMVVRRLDAGLTKAGILPEPILAHPLQVVRRRMPDGAALFIVNRGARPVDEWVSLRNPVQTAAIFDPLSGRIGGAALRRVPGASGTEVYLQLAPGASRILRTFEEGGDRRVHGLTEDYTRVVGEQLLSGPWAVSFISGGPLLPESRKLNALRSWTQWDDKELTSFSGLARYTTTVVRPEGQADPWLLDLGRVAESARVRWNGHELGISIAPPHVLEIPASLIEDENLLEVEVANLMANRIAAMDRRGIEWKRFYNVNMAAKRAENRDSDGLFSAAAWQPRESGLIGPVRLLRGQRFDPRDTGL